jgi:subtilisin-like proprotein convertase family protein
MSLTNQVPFDSRRRRSLSRRACFTSTRRLFIESLEDRSLLATVSAPTAIDQARDYLTAQADSLGLDSPRLSDLAHVFTHHSSVGSVERFEQRVQGLPVYNAEIAVTLQTSGEVTYVYSTYQPGLQLVSTMPVVAPAEARLTAAAAFDLQGPYNHELARLLVFPDKAGARLAYQVELSPISGKNGAYEVIVDARSGAILQARDQAERATGTGMVFNPDPLTTASAAYGATGYTDANDADSTQLSAQRQSVTLQDITLAGSTYSLVGPYAHIVDVESPSNGLFAQTNSNFSFTRTQNGFEAVNAYYHLDKFLRYLNVTLGLDVMPIQYTGGVRFDPSGESGDDNSHYDPTTGVLVFGEGGVDDAEDADVLIHELGHGIHDWVTGGNLSSEEGLSEGIGDYFAQSYSRALGLWPLSNPAYQYTFSWDGHNPFWNGRTTNYTAHYPSGLTGDEHDDGQIWATANMKVWDLLGATKTNTLMVEGLAVTGAITNQEEAAQALLQAAFNLGYTATEIHSIFLIYQDTGYSVTEPIPPTELRGTVWNDLNGNRTREAGENGQSGWTVFVDTNNNGTRDAGSGTFISTDVPKALPDLATVTSQTVVSTLTNPITDVNVTLSLTHTYDGDLEITLISPLGTRVKLAQKIGSSGDNFTNTVFDQQASTSISSGSAPFTGTFRPTASLDVLNGTGGNGTWTLEVVDTAGGDSGNLTSWQLAISSGEASAVTSSTGAYALSGLTGGNYTVREVAQATWAQTVPVSGSYSVTLATGQTQANLDFANTQGNTAPLIANVPDQTIAEDGSAAANFTVSDVQTAATSLILSAGTSNPTLLPLSGVVFSGTGTNRTVTFTPAVNEFGTATVTLTVTDGGGLTAQDTFVVTVSPINDRPSFTKGADATATNDAGPQSIANWATSISPGPANETSQTVSFQVTGNSNSALFSAGPLVAANGTLTFTPAAGAVGTATITIAAQDNGGTANSGVDTSLPQTFTITINPSATFQVLTSSLTNTGAVISLSRDVAVAQLNLYDTQGNPFGSADVTLVGATVGNVKGSLVVDPNLRRLAFVKTVGVLAPDTYTLTLRSEANGFLDTSATLLDGDANGTAGGNYVRTFVVDPPATGAVTLSIGNFARGPQQQVNMPANSPTGLPVAFSDGGGITSANFELRYNPALLTVQGAGVMPGLPANAGVTMTMTTPGVAVFQFTSPTPLPPGTTNFVQLLATVPNIAGYRSKHVLDLTNISLNGGAIPAIDDDAIHLVAYFGDANGSNSYNSADASLTSRVAIGLDQGLAAYRQVDPVIIIDLNESGNITSADSSRSLQLAVGTVVSNVPFPLPSGAISLGGPDPKISVPSTLLAEAGSDVTIPVQIDSIVDLTDTGLSSADLVLFYDPAVITINTVDLGSLLANAGGWVVSSRIEPLAGRVSVSLIGKKPLGGVFVGDLVELQATVAANAPAGGTAINLAESAKNPAQYTSLNDGNLTLVPAPKDAANDPIDGLVTILPNPATPPFARPGVQVVNDRLQITGTTADDHIFVGLTARDQIRIRVDQQILGNFPVPSGLVIEGQGGSDILTMTVGLPFDVALAETRATVPPILLLATSLANRPTSEIHASSQRAISEELRGEDITPHDQALLRIIDGWNYHETDSAQTSVETSDTNRRRSRLRI